MGETESTQPELALSVLCRGRLPALRRCVNSALALAGVPIQIAVFFDDDPATFEAYDPPQGVHKELLRPRHYYVQATNRAYRFFRDAGFDVIGFVNNDSEFLAPGWAGAVKEFLWEHFDDGMGVIEMSNEEGKCAHFVTRVPFVEKYLGGVLANPAYMGYYSDRELLDIVEDDLDRYRHIIPNDPSRAGWLIQHNEWDEHKSEFRKWYAVDKETYKRRAAVRKQMKAKNEEGA